MRSEELIAVLSSLVEGMPAVSARKSGNHASFVVGRKVFAYTTDGGVVMKLPKSRVAEVSARPEASPLIMGKRVMAEWVIIRHEEPEALRDDLSLLQEAHRFVSSEGQKKA